MKYIYNIAIVSFLAVLMSSCENYLDITSESSANSETIFQSTTKAEEALVGCYPYTFNAELFYQFGMGTDECFSTESTTNSKNQVANYVYTTANIPTSTYTAMYTGIEYANVDIKGLKGMTGSTDNEQTKINMLLGEAYAIRAMNYFNLVRIFGDVPYTTIPTADATSFYSSRVSRDTIMDGCVSDLQKAIELLPWKSAGLVSTPERFTKNSAYGILARIALYAAGYSLRWDLSSYDVSSLRIAQRSDATRIKELYKIAIDACQAVIDKGENSLLSDYATVFRDLELGKYNSETMLEYGQYGTNVNGTRNGYTNGIYCHTSSMYGKSQPAMAAIPTYWYDFSPSDTRRNVTICNYAISSANAHLMNSYSSNTNGKFRVNWKSEIGTSVSQRDINFPVLRYSDILLMYAEALNEYNGAPTSDAIAAYEKVRLRAFGGDKTLIGSTPTTYTAFKDSIIKERKLEFGFESLRRTDLERWGILYETLTQTKQNLIDMAKRTGNYANIDIYRVYKADTVSAFQDPLVAISYTGYQSMTKTDSIAYVKKGYTVLNMLGISPLNSQGTFVYNSSLITNLFRGLEKNKVEILPLNSTTIDINKGLEGEQQPAYK
jgi:starch-binding outer membrane protein, SusD/RagB family